MLYKKHKIKAGFINLVRVKLDNINEDVCNLCPGFPCNIMGICAGVFFRKEDGVYDYKLYSRCYIKEKQ